ncbi:unnamed protein product [Linum trigynum]|uniref:Uncharacterized protein n=1 Tax=Linum trigynum TaxID=586398 RepID=A0AAV2ET96_9ROSI
MGFSLICLDLDGVEGSGGNRSGVDLGFSKWIESVRGNPGLLGISIFILFVLLKGEKDVSSFVESKQALLLWRFYVAFE